MGTKARTLQFVALVGLVIYSCWPLLTPGFIPTHDGEYHIIRIWQFSKMLGLGYWFPRWAPDVNSGFGLPLFNFQYPFPNYVGSLLHGVGLSLADSVKGTLFTGYALSVVFCFLWLSTLFPAFAAYIGTVIFMFVPYWFVNMFIRGSIGEVLAMAWVMMALWATEKNNKVLLAVSIGLLIVTHNISAMLFVPVVGLYAFIRRRSLWGYLLLGIGLASYFWLPALFERQYVTGLNTVNFADYFPRLDQLLIPSWGSGFSGGAIEADAMSVQIGIIPLIIFFISCVYVAFDGVFRTWSWRSVFWLLVTIFSIAFMLPQTQNIWKSVPGLSYVQYPWRLLAFLLPAAAFFGAYATTKVSKVAMIGIAVFAVVLTATYVRPVTYAPRSDNYYLSRENFTDGTSSMGNAFSTIWTGWKSTRAQSPAAIVKGQAVITHDTKTGTRLSVTVNALNMSVVQLNQLYYPGWRIEIDGQPQSYTHKDGLMQADVPKGTHAVEAEFGETPLRAAADGISILSLAVLLSFSYRDALRTAYKRLIELY